MKTRTLECDVLVVGLGPVGAVLATLLGQSGRSVIAIEPQRDIYPLPRAAHVDHEIMRIFQALGIAETISPYIRTAPDYEFCAADGGVLIRIEREGVIGESGWPVGFNVYQPGIERAVRDRLEAFQSVRTMFGARFLAVDSQGYDSIIALVGTEDAGECLVRADLLVGCDGAWSSVRGACGITLDDYGFDEPWLVLDGVVPDEARFPPMNLQLCDPNRPTTFVHMGPGRLRWEFMLKPDEDAVMVRRPESIDALLAPWRALGEIAVERTAVYRFHGLVARDWRQGRVLLAGDAAHQMPPFMGQGLCSGLRDAANLAWKIDYVLGSGRLALLDSYQTERDPHVRFIIERAIEMGRTVCTLDAVLAATRDADMLANPRVGPPTPFPAIHGLTLDDSPDAGAIFAQPVVAAEGRLDDMLGAGAWLIHRGGTAQPQAVGLRFVDTLRDLPPGIASALTAWLERRGVEAVLVRPDRYVFGTGATEQLVRTWRDRLQPERVAA